MKKGKKGFDWYAARQRFSIRKFHFGAASILLGVSLVLGTGTKVSASEEIPVSPLGQEVVVSEERSDGLPLSEEVSPETSTLLPVSEAVKEEVVTEPVQPADVLQSEEVQSDPNHPVEEEALSRQAVISYTVRYIDPMNEVISSETLSMEVTTVDQQASYSLVQGSTLPEGYRLVVDQAAQQTVDILEGVDNLITFRIEKIDSSSTELTEDTVSPQVENVSQPSSAGVEGRAEERVVVEEVVKTEVSVPISPSLTELSKEFVEPVSERTVHIPYKVVQTDVETGEEKKLGQVGYVSVTTTDEVAKTEVTVTADKLDSGYSLADDQPNVITKVVAENETNILSFAVTRKKDEKDNPLTETTVTASGDAEGTSGFRTIENAPRSTNTVSYVTTEWVIPDEVKAANTGLDVAAGDASVAEATTAVPTAYKTTLPDGREVFMVLSLNSQIEPNKTTTFNNKYNKDYFFQFSISKEGEINKVYADLVDKRQNNKILESIEIAQGSTAKFNTLSQYENAGYTYRFQFTPDPSNSTSKNLKINNPNGGNVNTVIYDKVSPNSVGTELNIFNVLVPVRTTQETKYVVKATEKRAEETLATYIQKGALTGDSYTIAGALDFDKYELIAEDVPTVLQGDLAADYKVGAKTIQSIMTHNLVRVLEVTQKDGTHKAHIYLLNPDGPNRLALDRKTNITEADLTSENFIKFFTSEEIVPGAVNTLEGRYSYTSKHQFESFKTDPHTFTNVITGETMLLSKNGESFPEGNFFIPEHKAVSLKGKDGKAFGFGGATLRMVNDNVSNEQHVTYYYAEKGGVVVHYVDETGQPILQSVTLVDHGTTGTQYNTASLRDTEKTINGTRYLFKQVDSTTSALKPVTENTAELRHIVKVSEETGNIERDTLKELTYVYEKAAKAKIEIYTKTVNVENNQEGPEVLDTSFIEQDRKGSAISTTATNDYLRDKLNDGYEIVSDNFMNAAATFDSVNDIDGQDPSQVFKIVLRERIKTVTPDAPKEPNTPLDPTNPTGPKYPEGVRATDLNESVKRTIKYQYEGGAEARPTVEETLTFTRTAKVNVVTGALAYTPWFSTDDDFNQVDTEAIAGYTPDKASVAAEADVPAEAPDKEVIVTYVKDAQKATITYQDEGGNQLGTVDEVTGKSGEPINYTTTARITELINQGYEVVTDGFTREGGQVFDTDKTTDQTFTVVVRAKVVTVTPEDPKNPGTEVDPGNPDGPEWPDGVKATDLNETVTRTIKYQYEDGSQAKDDVVETLTYKRTATVNLVTKEVTYGEWTSTDNAFDKVDTEAIAGYTPDKASVAAEADVPAEAPDKEVIVTYVKDAQKATITYQDEGGNQLGTVDEVTGKSGEPINYTTTARITELINQGYEVVTDGFTREGGQVFDTDKTTDQTFTVVVRAKVVTVTPEDPKNPGTEVDPGNPDGPEWPDGVKATDLNETVTRTIKYQYEDGSQAKDDVVETLTYKRTATVNLVTKEVTYGEWTSADDDFDKVDTPAIAGYTPDKASVEAELDVPATAADKEVIVTYVKDAQKATITYKDEGDQQLGAIDEVTGKSGEPINYTTTARITELTNQGYEVVSDGFTKDGGQVYDTDKATDQTFEVVVRAKVVTVTPEDPKDPGTEVDPGNPDGPEWPDGVKATDLNETVKRTIKYQYEDGSEAQPDVVETLTYKRTATVNLVTKEVTYGDWTSTDDDFDKVDTPAIAGYTADKASVEAELDVPATAADKEVIVRYVKDAQKATITYQDENGQQLGGIDEVIGKSGEPINYTTTARITELTNQGYEVVTDGFTKEGGQVFDTDKDTPQTFTVIVKAKVVSITPDTPQTPVTPVDPNNPDGPKWPDGLKESDLNQTVTRTIKYVYEDGSPVLNSDGSPLIVTQTASFKRSATVNLVTGQVTYGAWSEDQTVPAVPSPIILGYYTETASVAAHTFTVTDIDQSITVVYKKLGAWVPNIPGQPVTPIPYPNHPTDPGKPGTDLPVLPHIPGYVPVGPDGVTPLTPVDPNDPSKGYNLPPVPSDPSDDVPITYVPFEPVLPTHPTSPSQSNTSKVEKTSPSTLPNTGDSSADIIWMTGLSLLLATIGMVVKVHREE
ncbi:mucin-binding protein [Streptococcus suis]|uniref:mucin-binding protein n=1 Tax=Streptococcus suis TaxID=1307 RepID=UPI001ABE50D6|nr:YSIRK-type signal peptide-containing protein [Streptococcus suis]